MADSHDRVIAVQNAEVTAAEVEIKALLKLHHRLQDEQAVLLNAPGVGLVTATVLMAEMPELGSLTAKTAAPLARL